MIVAEINILDCGSTGKIMNQISRKIRKSGGVAYTYSRGWKNQKKADNYNRYVGSYFENGLHYIIGKILNMDGFFSIIGTLKLIHEIKINKIDVIHLHNLHYYCYNLPLLFSFLKKYNRPVIWTFHDCWPFTGHCFHYSLIGCDKWKIQCSNCPKLKHEIDNVKIIYKIKRKLFTGLENLTIVAPSEWMAQQIKNSYFSQFDTRVIYNGIDLNIFNYHESNFRSRYNIQNKHIVLGVAFAWGYGKGIDIFVELAGRLGEQYQIVLVGIDDKIKNDIPDNIIKISNTRDQIELAKIYSVADVFVNPTREEVFGLVNVEALACGTPVITFDVGGSPETVDTTCGVVVKKDDLEKMKDEIENICENKMFSREACRLHALKFSKENMENEYYEILENVNIK